MKKSFNTIALVGVGNVINAALGFAFLSAAAKALDLPEFGKYALLTTLLLAVSKLIDFGTNSVYVTKSISEIENKLAGTFYSLKLILLIISLPIGIIILNLLHLNEGNIPAIFALGLGAYTISYTLYAFFQKLEKYIPLVFLNTLPAIVKGTFALLVFLGFFQLTLEKAFTIFSLSMFMGLPLLFLLPKGLKKAKLSLKNGWNILKAAFPAGVSQLIYEGWPSLSNSIAKIIRGFSDVGIFSLANKISTIFVLASYSIFTVLLPKNAIRKKEKKGYDFQETYIISAGIILLAVVAIIVSELFITQFFGEKFIGSIPLLKILIFASALTSIHTFLENYFFVEQKTKFIMYANTSKLVVFLVLALTLTPLFGLSGLAYANLFAAILGLVTTGIFIKRTQNT